MFSLSKRSDVEPFHAMDVLAEATRRRQAGHAVISMAVGQPSHPTPRAALEAARTALDHGRIGYTDALGTLALKQALAGDYRARHGLEIDPARIAITTGSSAGFNLAFLTLFDPGDSVAIARPGYPAYRNILAALGLDVVEVPVTAETHFTLTPESLEAAQVASGKRLKGVLLASPANPTGTVTGRAALKALADYCADRSIAFISDEIYHGLTFVGEETSALELTDEAIVINSFSKYYCMTGWRIGWMVLPERLVRPVERVAQSLYISAPELSQIAATAALGAGAELDTYRESYRRNRDFLMQRLPEIGFSIASPMDGAFYAYVDVTRFTNDSMAFARKMLADINVAATPGLDFDPIEGHRAMRLSYAGSNAEIEEAVERMAAWLK
ncbi:aminotransferase class I/II-fold pyridoxal phosphate-dependent enzyme [Agrobacterium sp. SHOUNA12C]|uniref:pyridoxal phosphate-dependent aminotransferase n=1 Tax=Rhizobium rhizogenes TaxID=359 RepID=UPI0004D8BB46|nr:aminotransferase class I/II-fold pyridoxal phosphate-dependent enzyme [Rhizobium rhizogenes]MCJ9756866.1 aminotransferase class I/II-fold pyridoxal phosphate-dependent enzyme [Agrobacterium sp. SHOUNA12C]OCJ06771.1 1-aminocyclopropane-1-carboxylate deaminase [Agrobacterium sp. 13-626]KEA07186.1 1-aminocyclopropane-1-carboxylate deaminase [Rhizobium rhizogenes]MQB29336.1 aminotransferase class I/II-fold pyridoxal phosphate-dependent enzyme [Rhizobium rhizogenes]NTF67676.1 aminotransferase cl